MERETRIELATNSLEGCDSTIELLPPFSFANIAHVRHFYSLSASQGCLTVVGDRFRQAGMRWSEAGARRLLALRLLLLNDHWELLDRN